MNRFDYQNAIKVLDASNLSGVLHSFSEVVSRMVQEGMDNPTRDNHPITILYVSKLMELTGLGLADTEKFSIAYDECQNYLKDDYYRFQEP